MLPHTLQLPPRGYTPRSFFSHDLARWPVLPQRKHVANDIPPPTFGSGHWKTPCPVPPQLKHIASAPPLTPPVSASTAPLDADVVHSDAR